MKNKVPDNIEKIVNRIYLIMCDMANLGLNYEDLQRTYTELVDNYNLEYKFDPLYDCDIYGNKR